MSSNLTRIGKAALRLGIQARTLWLIALSCFTLGWLACAAWVAIIHFAPQVAADLIGRVS